MTRNSPSRVMSAGAFCPRLAGRNRPRERRPLQSFWNPRVASTSPRAIALTSVDFACQQPRLAHRASAPTMHGRSTAGPWDGNEPLEADRRLQNVELQNKANRRIRDLWNGQRVGGC
ncbi:MAG: hypothetical protein IT536_06270 [Hyphomicrobiales bacterium]|nr:hypothetical protein [Hyphomicrobiales bacterium]